MEHTNETKTEERSIELTVLEKIRTDSISMHSKTYYYVRVGLAILVAFIVFCVSTFLVDFMIFVLRASGRSLLLGFGGKGVLFFFEAFPWLVLAGDVVLIVVLDQLLRQFKFAYRFPAVYILATLLCVSALAGYGLASVADLGHMTPSRDGRAPVGAFFSRARRAPLPQRGVCRCTIVDIDGSQLAVIDPENGNMPITVVLPENDPHVHVEDLEIGDRVFIAGDLRGAILYAFGLHKVAPDEPAFEQPF